MSFEHAKEQLRTLIMQRFVACFKNEATMMDAILARETITKNGRVATDNHPLDMSELQQIFDAIDNPPLNCIYGYDQDRSRGYVMSLQLNLNGLKPSDLICIDAAVCLAIGKDYDNAALGLDSEECMTALSKEVKEAFFESVYVLLKPLAEEQLYLRAKKRLEATLQREPINPSIIRVANDIIVGIEQLKRATDRPISVEKLAAALRSIHQTVLNQDIQYERSAILIDLQQHMTEYNTEHSKKLAASLGILIGITIILTSLAFAIATAGVGTPASIGGIYLGAWLITTAVIGASMTAAGGYQLHQINLAQEALEDQMDAMSGTLPKMG